MRSGWERGPLTCSSLRHPRLLSHPPRDAGLRTLCARRAAGDGRRYRAHLRRSPLSDLGVTAKAHNMLEVDDANVDRATARGRDVFWHSDPRLDVFAATHNGYAKSHGVTHRRATPSSSRRCSWFSTPAARRRTGTRSVGYLHSRRIWWCSRAAASPAPQDRVCRLPRPSNSRACARARGCSLAELGGSREIDWVALDKPARRGDDNRFVVLMLPFAKTAPQVAFTAAPSPPGTACVTLRRGDRTDTPVFGSGTALTLGRPVGHRWPVRLAADARRGVAGEGRERRGADLGGSGREGDGLTKPNRMIGRSEGVNSEDPFGITP